MLMYAILIFKVIEKGHYIHWLFVLKFVFKTTKKMLKVLEDILGLGSSVLGTCGLVNITGRDRNGFEEDMGIDRH